MNANIQNIIDPLGLSFRQLRTLLPGTVGQSIPTADDLSSPQHGRLFSFTTVEMVITVFDSGWVLAEGKDSNRVFAVDRCRTLQHTTEDSQIEVIQEKDFAEGPCLIPLLINGANDKAAHLQDYEYYWQEFLFRNDEIQ